LGHDQPLAVAEDRERHHQLKHRRRVDPSDQSDKACERQGLHDATFDKHADAAGSLGGAGAARRNDERHGQWDHHEARVERGKVHRGLHEQRDEKIE